MAKYAKYEVPSVHYSFVMQYTNLISTQLAFLSGATASLAGTSLIL